MVPPALSPFCFTFYPLSNVCSTPGTREQEGLHSHPLARPPGQQGPESRRAFIATPQLCRPGRQCRVLNWALSSHLSADTPLPRCLAMLALTLRRVQGNTGLRGRAEWGAATALLPRNRRYSLFGRASALSLGTNTVPETPQGELLPTGAAGGETGHSRGGLPVTAAGTAGIVVHCS